MGPGGAPDLQTLIAGMRNGKPQLDAAVSAGGFRPHEHARLRAGALSQRTDTQAITTPTGMPYGEAGALRAGAAGSTAAADADAERHRHSAPTQRPAEPVTHGADAGPGADSSILRQPGQPATGGAFPRRLPALLPPTRRGCCSSC
jgi:hypothetical protein